MYTFVTCNGSCDTYVVYVVVSSFYNYIKNIAMIFTNLINVWNSNFNYVSNFWGATFLSS